MFARSLRVHAYFSTSLELLFLIISSAEELKIECLTFIEENALDMFNSKNHLSLPRSCMIEILRVRNFMEILIL